MSKSSKIFDKALVDVQNRSGFDLSHYNLGSMSVGTLIPILAEELSPGSRIHHGLLGEFNMPPLAANFYGRVDVKVEAFFVPYRLVLASWKKFATYANEPNRKHAELPYLRIPVSQTKAGTLADFLGFKHPSGEDLPFADSIDFPNPLPFLAYHCIYNHWYRDKHIQKDIYDDELDTNDGIPANILPLLHTNSFSNRPVINPFVHPDDPEAEELSSYADGVPVWALRQRNYHKDYFTTATTKPQAGDPVRVKFDVVDSEGAFSIATLRAANSLQKFCERNNLASPDYADQLKANYGVRPSDAVMSFPIYLGSQTFDCYNRSVFQTSHDTSTASQSNPFHKTTGAEFAKMSSFGKGSLVDSFEVTEQGIYMVLASLVPHSFYGSGVRRYLYNHELADFPIPLLANVGDQPIYKNELKEDIAMDPFTDKAEFGYTGRYSECKFHGDEVHGLLMDDQILDAYALKRTFVGDVELGTDFLQIKKDALDNVMAVKNVVTNFTAWYQIYHDFRVSTLLPVYSIPTLGDDKDTHKVLVDKNGTRL